jgi:fibronectin type 3 domain-containing protein
VFEDHIRVSWEGREQPKEEAAPVIVSVIIPLMIPPMTVPVTLPTTPSTTPAPTAGFNVYRSEGENPAVRMNSALLETSEFLDKDFLFGRTYRYFVRAALGSKPPLESDDSEAVEVAAKDVFPPAPPSGLTAIGGRGFIALSWEGGRESDLTGFRVWRRPAGEGEFAPVATLTGADSSFSDLKVEKNQRYEYAITALDSAGNESPRSAAVTGVVRD